MGELLEAIEPRPGANQNIGRGAPTNVTRTEVAREAGLSKDQQVQAVRVARVPEDQFTEQVESDTPPTVTSLAAFGTKKRQQFLPAREGARDGKRDRGASTPLLMLLELKMARPCHFGDCSPRTRE